MLMNINPAIVRIMRKAGFFPDTLATSFMVMKALYEKNYELLNVLDDSNLSKRIILVYYDLVRKGLWEEAAEGKLLFQFTAKGENFFKELLALGTVEETALVTDKPIIKKPEDVFDWIKDWMDLWPRGLKSGGKLVRSDAKSCFTKMQKFLRDYPHFNKNLIFRATKNYLDEQERKGWAYTKCAVYFIHKQGEGSELASRCELLKDVGEEDIYAAPSTKGQFFI